MTNLEAWAAVPFHFWSVTLFTFGCIVGSFLNVCIHRLPRGLSVISPPSHCPECKGEIPWYLNVPVVTWLYLRGKCAHCGKPISPRYLLVELLTGLLFLALWLQLGNYSDPLRSLPLVLILCAFTAGLIVATFIDFEHFIIPDEITLGGIVAGFVLSFLVPGLHGMTLAKEALRSSFLGILVGGGVVYAILRIGKFLFGRQQFPLADDSKVLFTETSLHLPDQEIPYEELFYRKTDAIELQAKTALVSLKSAEGEPRPFENVPVRLTPMGLRVGKETFAIEEVPRMEVVTNLITVPREAMGLGDVKFMAAIGAFLGWPAVIFSLMTSAMIGSVVGVSLIAVRKQQWSSRLPYGPYIALAALIWVFFGPQVLEWWNRLGTPV